MPGDKALHRWLDLANEKIPFHGLPARNCWLGLRDRVAAGLAMNEMFRRGELSAPVVIGRDHVSSGSVASPNRESEGMLDGSDAVSDWALLNALLNCASGATWVSIHHGGGVGIGYSQHAGLAVVCDGSAETDDKIEAVFGNDSALSIFRHADAGYPEAIATLDAEIADPTEIMAAQGIAQQLANWVVALDWAHVPLPVRDIATACVVDTIGVAIAGANESVTRLVRDHVGATYAAGPCSVLGSAHRCTAAGAADLANGTAAHALDFDDNCYAGLVHGSAVVLPAVFAAGEAGAISGADLLCAFIAGAEVEYALGSALGQRIYDKGWWTSGVLGAIGAAAGAAKAMRLSPEQAANAIAIAAAGTGGMRACLGSDAKPILAGRAAESGVTAAALAACGATGPLFVFEESRGLGKLFNDGQFDQAALASLGASWRLQSPGIDVKKYPLCLSSHAAADGVLDLVREHDLSAGDVASVTCTVPATVAANLTYAIPSTRQEAQFSLPFAVACMMVFGDITLECLQAAQLSDAKLVRAMQKVRMVVADNWDDQIPADTVTGPEGAMVRIVTTDGRKIERFSGWARGTAARPLSNQEHESKFRSCAGRTLPAREVTALLAMLKRIATLPDVRAILRDLAPAFVQDAHQRS